MQWGARSSDALAALRTLLLNEGWDTYWHDRRLIHLTAA
jgi:spore cortex formation protein SpoVR/YcgB (stage V sporulation)